MELVDLFLVAIVLGTAVILYRTFYKAGGDDLGLGLAATNSSSSSSSSSGPRGRAASASADDESKPRVVFLYGSQSGTAEMYATEMSEEAVAYGMRSRASDLSEYDYEMDLDKETFVVLLLATFGEGEPTDNAADFYTWIQEQKGQAELFEDVTFALFALGNRQYYENFCLVGYKVDELLRGGGAVPLVPMGVGDDSGTMEEDFAAWKAKFWASTVKRFGLAPPKDTGHVVVPYSVTFKHKDRENKQQTYGPRFDSYKFGLEGFQPDIKYRARLVPVVENREIRLNTSDGQTRHLELDIGKSSLKYNYADNLGVFARNDPRLAAKMAKRLKLHPETLFSLRGMEGQYTKLPYPSVCSVQDALWFYCDFTAIPRVNILKVLANYATDIRERAQLLRFGEEDKQAYLDDQKDHLELLEAFPSVDLPFDVFLHIVPKLAHNPRYYTISSSASANVDRISLTVVISESPKPRNRVYKGVCSNYLLNANPTPRHGKSERLCVFVRPSAFRLPRQLSSPVIMCGPGTGVAPFMAFLQEARVLQQKDKQLGKWVLYYGCRYEQVDWIYKQEMQEAVDDGRIYDLQVAFSRDDKKKKTYVQDLMGEARNGAQIWELIHNQNGSLYVCGGASMGQQVKLRMIELCKKYGNMAEEDAHEYIKELQHGSPTESKRYIQELWS